MLENLIGEINPSGSTSGFETVTFGFERDPPAWVFEVEEPNTFGNAPIYVTHPETGREHIMHTDGRIEEVSGDD